jgi:hypothetical protein
MLGHSSKVWLSLSAKSGIVKILFLIVSPKDNIDIYMKETNISLIYLEFKVLEARNYFHSWVFPNLLRAVHITHLSNLGSMNQTHDELSDRSQQGGKVQCLPSGCFWTDQHVYIFNREMLDLSTVQFS